MDNSEKIRNAVGAYSVYLAALSDAQLMGRFTQVNGAKLLDHQNKATKRSFADVLVYMAAAYEKSVTLEEVEMGLLAATSRKSSIEAYDAATLENNPEMDSLGDHYAEQLQGLLKKKAVGL